MKNMVKKGYGLFLSLFVKVGGYGLAKKVDSRIRFKRKIELNNPVSLSDKIIYIELYKRSPLASSCTDKFEVRNYVTDKGLEHILVPIVGGPWNNLDEINFDKLPRKFVLKGTHGCKMNYIVDDKMHLDKNKCYKEMNRWLKTTYGKYSIEPHYLEITHRIYAEYFLGNQESLIDYKFYCLNGVPSFVNVSSDRHSDGDKAMVVTQELYDLNWKPIFEVKKSRRELPGKGNITKPKNLYDMIEIAKILSKDFDFVRVDLYNVNGKIYFGELTFTPFAGVLDIYTDKFNEEMGKKLKI